MIIIIFIYQYTQCNVSKRRNHFDWFLTTQLVGGSLKIPILLVGQHADILALRGLQYNVLRRSVPPIRSHDSLKSNLLLIPTCLRIPPW